MKTEPVSVKVARYSDDDGPRCVVQRNGDWAMMACALMDSNSCPYLSESIMGSSRPPATGCPVWPASVPTREERRAALLVALDKAYRERDKADDTLRQAYEQVAACRRSLAAFDAEKTAP